MIVSDDDISQKLSKLCSWSKARNYCGYNKHDGLNSPLLRLFLGWSKWPRIFAIQGVMRFPINIRPLLLVKKSYNPKGIALFTQAYLYQYQLNQNPVHLQEAEKLLALLIKIQSHGDWSGTCWGYHYPWQDPGFYAPTNTPNAVVSSFVCEAFLQAYRITHKPQYLETVKSVIFFYLNDLQKLKQTDSELCFSYMPLPMTMRVMDVSILIAAVIAQYAELSNDDTWLEDAHRLAQYVSNQQTEEGAWFYTDPPQDSLIRHDNYHTGFILDAFERYQNACSNPCKINYQDGLTFYANNLFNADGSPKWMSDKDFPHDIHGAAQGIITFSRHRDQYQNLLQTILQWATATMWHPDGRFYYQQTNFRRKKFTLMRWCNAWMARALAEYLYRNSLQADQ